MTRSPFDTQLARSHRHLHGEVERVDRSDGQHGEGDGDHIGATGRHVDHEVGERRPALLGDRLDGEQAGEVAVGLVVALADQFGEAAAVAGMAERRQAAERREQPQDQRLAEVGPFGGGREIVAPGVTRDPPSGGTDAEVEPAPRVGNVER